MQQIQPRFQEKISSMFEKSLSEEQLFLQEVMTGKIKLIPHDEVMRKLEDIFSKFPL